MHYVRMIYALALKAAEAEQRGDTLAVRRLLRQLERASLTTTTSAPHAPQRGRLHSRPGTAGSR
jgi:hypothetical protein